MSSPRDPLALPAPEGGVVELTKIFESFGLRVRVDDASNDGDDERTMSVVALNDDGEEVVQSPQTQLHKANELDIFDRKCKNSKHPEDVQATGRMLLDSGTRSSIAEYLEQTDGKEVSSWGVFSFCIILWQKHLADKRNHKILDEMLRGEEIQRTMDMITRLPEEARGVVGLQYVHNEISDQYYRKRNQQLSNAAKTLLKIVCFFVLIYFIVEKLVPIANTLLDTANVTAEAAKDAAEAVKKTTETGKEGVFVLNDMAQLVIRVGKDVTNKANNLWTAWWRNSDNTENVAIEKMFIVGSGQSEKERLCFLDFLTEIHEFVEEEIRSLFPHWIPYVSKAATQTYVSTNAFGKEIVHRYAAARPSRLAEKFLDTVNCWNLLGYRDRRFNSRVTEYGKHHSLGTKKFKGQNFCFDDHELLTQMVLLPNVALSYTPTQGTVGLNGFCTLQKFNPASAIERKSRLDVGDGYREAIRDVLEKLFDGWNDMRATTNDGREGVWHSGHDGSAYALYFLDDTENGQEVLVPILRHEPSKTNRMSRDGTATMYGKYASRLTRDTHKANVEKLEECLDDLFTTATVYDVSREFEGVACDKNNRSSS